MTNHSVGILGLGAMGSLYAAKLMDSGDDVVVIAKGDRADRIQRDGFTFNDRAYQPNVLRPDQARPLDLIIVGVKQHHLEGVLDDIAPFIGEHTQIISVLNGIDSEEMLIARFGEAHVLYCVAVAMTPVRDGHHVRTSNMGRLIFGEAKNTPPAPRVVRIQSILEKAGIAYQIPDDMLREMWWKLMINVAVNQTSSALRMTYAELRDTPSAYALMDGLGGEVIALSQAVGVNLTRKDLDTFYGILATLDADGKTSMLQDVEAGRLNEVDIFAGKIVALGKQYNVPTPYNTTLLHILRGLQPKNAING